MDKICCFISDLKFEDINEEITGVLLRKLKELYDFGCNNFIHTDEVLGAYCCSLLEYYKNHFPNVKTHSAHYDLVFKVDNVANGDWLPKRQNNNVYAYTDKLPKRLRHALNEFIAGNSDVALCFFLDQKKKEKSELFSLCKDYSVVIFDLLNV